MSEPEIEPMPAPMEEFLSSYGMGFDTAVDFGAGRFDKLEFVDARRKIGVEVCSAYIEKYKPEERGMEAVHGDIRDWLAITPNIGNNSVALVLDVVEHMYLGDGMDFLNDIGQWFDRILVATPHGFVPQTEDVWGCGNHYFQTHRSEWTEDRLRGIGFRIDKKDIGLIFAVKDIRHDGT